jgi:hypothetical protein
MSLIQPFIFLVSDLLWYLMPSPDVYEATWKLYYSARESYGPLVKPQLAPNEPLNPSFWHRLTETFETNATAFQLWNTRLSRGGAVSPCTGDCVRVSICDMRAARSQNNCVSYSCMCCALRSWFNCSFQDVDTPGSVFGFRRAVLEDIKEGTDLECGAGGLQKLFAHVMKASYV